MTDEQQDRFDRTPNTQQAGWFVDLHSAGLLDLDPPYQRRSIWNLEFRQFFIDSVIRNYPTQAVFVEIIVDPDRPTTYRVIDGKQRLTSLMMFLKDEFPTPDSLTDLSLADAYYSDLPPDTKRKLLSYKFTVENIQDARPTELNEVFDRLNRNVARLNRQELRHAKYGGEFARKMEVLAEDPFWDDIGLVTPSRRRRMLDVEYVSEFYVIVLAGIQEGKDYLDEVYSAYDTEIDNERSADRLFRQVRRTIEAIHELLPLDTTRFSNVADFYSLWAAITERSRESRTVNPDLTVPALRRFQDEVEEQETERSKSYLLAARQGSNKRANRDLRARILSELLV
jgi:hypothetical protein